MQTVTEILIDFSSSMNDRLSLVKEILTKNVIPELDFLNQIGIKTFTAVAANSNSLKIENILPLGVYTKSDIIEAIGQLSKPDDNTPIAQAIKDSVRSLKEFRLFDKRIVLVTDGEENCGGDYELEAKKAGEDGVFCEVHVIGIGLNETQLKQATRISGLTSGSVSNISLSNGNLYDFDKAKTSLINFTTNINRTNISLSNPVATTNVVSQQSVLVPPVRPDIHLIEDEVLQSTDITQPTGIITDNESSTKLTEEDRWETYDRKLDSISEQLQLLLSKETKRLQEDSVVDIEEDVELNEKIRVESEKYLNAHLMKKYHGRVVWLNESGESGQDHDFEITEFESQGIEYFIECKGTSINSKVFYITKNEWRRFLNSTKNYQIYFILNVFNNPSHIFIDNLLDWILKGKVVPYSSKNEAIKKERILFTILD